MPSRNEFAFLRFLSPDTLREQLALVRAALTDETRADWRTMYHLVEDALHDALLAQQRRRPTTRPRP